MEKEDSVTERKPIRQHPLFSKFKEFPSIDNGKPNVVKKFSTELADKHTW
jgi:hypothetical protein